MNNNGKTIDDAIQTIGSGDYMLGTKTAIPHAVIVYEGGKVNLVPKKNFTESHTFQTFDYSTPTRQHGFMIASIYTLDTYSYTMQVSLCLYVAY